VKLLATNGTALVFSPRRCITMFPAPGSLVDVLWMNHWPSGDQSGSASAQLSSSSSTTSAALPSERFVHKSKDGPARLEVNDTDAPSGVQVG
jgi:hypothetical protein